MIGSAIATDFARSGRRDVTVVDVDSDRLGRIAAEWPVRTVQADLSRPETIAALVGERDLIVGALPSAIGYRALRAAIESGRSIVDLSFMPEDALALDA